MPTPSMYLQASTAAGAARHGVYAELAQAVKSVVQIPVIGVGRINDPLLAESLLRSGKCDFVGMTRASMADPDLPRKVMEGRFEDVVPCVGCLIGCSGNLAKGLAASCVFNPAMGHETDPILNSSAARRHVVVVGGGVGGCMATITAARRGHRVTLIEQDAQLGGQFRYAAVPPEKGELTAYLAWQRTQLEKLGVTLLMNTEATPELLDAMEPDVVIVATGARPFVPPIPGARGEHVHTALQVLAGEPLEGKTCVVVGGGMVGAETAHHLEHHGWRVAALVELLPDVMGDMPRNARTALLDALQKAGIRIMTGTAAREITDRGLLVSHDGQEELLPADFVVIAAGSRADNALAEQLGGRPYQVIRIGDAVQARRAMDAIAEGYRAALEIGCRA